MHISDFDYELPDEQIARYPTEQRRASRLLEVTRGLVDRHFDELPGLLEAGDLLVFNDTRVIKARLAARKETGGRAEVLVERVLNDCEALVQLRVSKPPKTDSLLLFEDGVTASVTGRRGEFWRLVFSVPLLPFLEDHGEVPLPPYLERAAKSGDDERYQTVYAKDPGAVAAPTAGLHFDTRMLDDMLAAGVRHAYLTLHVGAGTFQALRHDLVEENRLHKERIIVNQTCCDAVNETRAAGGRVIAVGTTAVRALESSFVDDRVLPFDGDTDLFIYPGYRFHSIDAMITNFHLPKSSLLMLVAAFAGKQRVIDAYRHAVRQGYRFFSYGDSMFVTGSRQA